MLGKTILMLSLSLMAHGFCLAQTDQGKDAMQQAKELANQFKGSSFVNSSGAESVVPNYNQDVSELEKLFSKGQGNLLAPGQIKADQCLDLTSPDCLAVQTIYDTSKRPGWDLSDLDSILADRDQLIGSVNKLPGNDNDVTCETITTTTPPQTQFATCEQMEGATPESCFNGWVEKLDVTTLFQCIKRSGQIKEVSCLADYVSNSADYLCTLAPQQTCSVGTVVDISSKYRYQCQQQHFSQKSYRCNKVLKIEGFAGCEPGSMQKAQSSSDALGKDACNGGDTVELSYACSDQKVPLLRVETNVKGAANFGFDIQADHFEVEKTFSNCKGIWSGQTDCTGVNCTSRITMKVYYQKNGQFHYSGSLSKVFSYQTFSHDVLTEKWETTCASEADSLKASHD